MLYLLPLLFFPRKLNISVEYLKIYSTPWLKLIIKGRLKSLLKIYKANLNSKIYNHAINEASTQIYAQIWVCPSECFISNKAFSQTWVKVD